MLKYIHNWLCMMCGEQNFMFLWIIRWNPKSKQPKYTNSMWGEEGRKEDREATIRSCKVEFIQPSNWLYSVPNLLVFQHLVALYLGGLVVRVVSEIEWSLLKSVQENRGSRLGLAGDSRLQAARRSTRAKHARRWTVMLAGALQDKTGQLAIRLSRDWISRLSQVTRPSRELALFLKNLTFHIPLSP